MDAARLLEVVEGMVSAFLFYSMGDDVDAMEEVYDAVMEVYALAGLSPEAAHTRCQTCLGGLYVRVAQARYRRRVPTPPPPPAAPVQEHGQS